VGFGGTGWRFKGFFFRDSSSCGFSETALPGKGYSFVIFSHAVSAKPRYLEEAILS
jgi:hypothetical protein